MATQKYTNLGKGTLSSGYTVGDTSLHLGTGDGALFPSAGNFTVALDSPPSFFLLCTARSGDVLTVGASGSEGSTAANKASGVAVTEVITAGVLDGLRADAVQTGAYASAAFEKQGNLYLPTDSPLVLRDTGSAFALWGPVWPLTPPVEANFSWVNQGSAVLSTSKGVSILTMAVDPGPGDNLRIRIKSRPSSPPWTATAMLMPSLVESNFLLCGICVRESSTSKISFFAFSYGGAGIVRWGDTTTPTTWSSAGTANWYRTTPTWMRVTDDGTNLIFSLSNDGYSFIAIRTIVRTVYMAGGADQVGYFIEAGTAAANAMTVLDWKES